MTLTQTVPAYVTFDVEVTTVRRLSPSFVRVTFGGAELSDFHTGGPLGLRDTRIKLVVPASPGDRPVPEIDVSDPGWYRSWLALDPATRGHLRTYTARRLVGGSSPQLEVDFALHLDADGQGGPATVWAAQATPGQRLVLLGPNRRHPDPGGYEWHPPSVTGAGVGTAGRVLLVGDETALPAIASILETLPEEYAGNALVEVPCLEDAQLLAGPSQVEVTYLPRNDRHRGAPTLEALEGLRLGDARDGLYAWVAGEASVVRDVRRALVGAHGLAKKQVAFMGYWRQGRAEG